MEKNLREAAAAWQSENKEKRAIIVIAFECGEEDKESKTKEASIELAVLGKNEYLVESVAKSVKASESPLNRIVGEALTRNLIEKLMN